jgi:hypothetical protein
MQPLCFYRFSLVRAFSGNAVPLLLPFLSGPSIFGQCSPSAFTVFLWSEHFRAMQTLCFYRFSLVRAFSGNAATLLLPFLSGPSIFGQCSPSAFTVFLWSEHFRAMQTLCFYRFSLVRAFSGNAATLLLPFFSGPSLFGQCSHSAFTVFLWSEPFRAMQPLCFYRFSLVRAFSGNANCLYRCLPLKRTGISAGPSASYDAIFLHSSAHLKHASAHLWQWS